MEATELRILNAGETLHKYGMDHAEEYLLDEALIGTFADLHDVIEEVKAIKLIEDNDNTGVAVGKSGKKLAAAMECLAIAKLTRVFGRKSHNEPLRGEVNFSFTDLYYVDDELAVSRWKIVTDDASEYLLAMEALGIRISAPVIASAVAKAAAFVLDENSTTVVRVEVKTATLDMKGKIKELDDVAEDVIGLATGYLLTNETFVNGCTFAYRKGELGSKHILLELHIVDDVTGVKLKGVHSDAFDGITHHRGVSSRNGNVREKTMANGNYSVVVSYPTYVSQTIPNVGIEAGKIRRITIRLMKV